MALTISGIREVFSLALEQSEARLDDAQDVSAEFYAETLAAHNAAVETMAALDAMLGAIEAEHGEAATVSLVAIV